MQQATRHAAVRAVCQDAGFEPWPLDKLTREQQATLPKPPCYAESISLSAPACRMCMVFLNCYLAWKRPRALVAFIPAGAMAPVVPVLPDRTPVDPATHPF